ncbi:MAG: rhamnogalacturonan lyase [Opitutaceae bacterium]|nr:rhamnogalacturonan lyase [Opitutaceae bacterium]
MKRLLPLALLLALPAIAPAAPAARQMEALGRGIVALKLEEQKIFVSWRVLGTDDEALAFNLYRASGNGPPVKLNTAPLLVSNFTDTTFDPALANAYFVRPVHTGREQAPSARFMIAAAAPARNYLSIPLAPPPGGTTPDGRSYSYTANDCSAADLDGDGDYEIILKWDPTNSKDNAFAGYAGRVFLDAYQLDGTRLWRIDLGQNIRAGAHYTQFLAYDFDGDGRAELMCKTADGTIDATGRILGDPSADWREPAGTVVPSRDHTDSTETKGGGRGASVEGRILRGPEYLTVFDGRTGAALATTDYLPARGQVSDWGDAYANRSDRMNAAVACLDGARPSAIFCRGYYTRSVLVAWDWRDGRLTRRWVFDSDDGTPGNEHYRGQGNHGLSIADVDGDGRDDIIYGACAIGSDGRGLYSTGLGHGDALHVSDLDPARAGLEVFAIHENVRHPHGTNLRDARTGEILWSKASPDVGRGLAADLDPRHPGYECWASGRGLTGLWNIKGEPISERKPRSCNFKIWWDGDFLSEILDGNRITKWNWEKETEEPLLIAEGCTSNNGTKSTPALCADLLGDWREEVILRTTDNKELRIFTTPIPTERRGYTLMHDPVYRLSIAWQNSAYNQPSHTGFYLGAETTAFPRPNITVAARP